jgi:hypothetical protein
MEGAANDEGRRAAEMTPWRDFDRESRGRTRGASPELCPIPEPLNSAEQWESYHHLDLDGMTRFELRLTRARVFMRLARERRPHPWLLERLKEVQRRLGRER